jgi:hypothetical protein
VTAITILFTRRAHLNLAHVAFQSAQRMALEAAFPRAALSASNSFSPPPRTFATMELTAVTCIQRCHHVAFLRLPDRGSDNLHRWAFYDSMTEIQKGHRVPVLFEVPGLARYFLNGCDASCLPIQADAPGRDLFAQRLQNNAFMALYTSQPQ